MSRIPPAPEPRRAAQRRPPAALRLAPLRLAARALTVALLGLAPRLAHASACVTVDAERDGLSEDERRSARTLLEEALGEAGVAVGREGCTESWTLYHVRLGKSITVVVQGPRGTRRERVRTIEDLPATYHQLARALVAGKANTNDAAHLDRRHVTSAQSEPRRVNADAIWYARLGYGATLADGYHGGPAFGFGRRWELDSVGIDLGFLNFLMYQDGDELDGTSVGWIELGADHFFSPHANASAYLGAGLSLGSHSIPTADGNYENAGLQGEVTLGYEMFRASTIRLIWQAEATLPMYRLSRGDGDAVYAPVLQLSLGLGWGARSR